MFSAPRRWVEMERGGEVSASMRGRLALTLSTLKRQTGVLRLCIRAPRWLAMTSKHTFTSSRRDAPEALLEFSAQRGRGERRVPAAPAASCARVVVESTRVTTSTPESPDVPARNGFTAYFALSSVTGLFCHRRPR